MTLGSIRHPEILSKTISENKVEMGLKIPRELAYFEGHFSELPVVPGVVQLHWAVEFAREFFDLSGFVSQGSQIKFSNLMNPLDEPYLILEHLPEKSMVLYSYKANEKIYASGRFIYSPQGKESNV
jgi:3-hydroxymyristoyl/3-hydroxydecanoyl-(acyl carrier protein) dehydratase